MKRKFFTAFMAVVVAMSFVACGNNSKNAENEALKSKNKTQEEQLQELTDFVVDISTAIDSINVESESLNQLTSGKDGMPGSVNKQQVLASLDHFRQTIATQKQRIADLEKRLTEVNDENDETVNRLKSIITFMKSQIELKDAQIVALRKEISAKDANISNLTGQVTELTGNVNTLKTDVSNLKTKNQAQEQEIVAQKETNAQQAQVIQEQTDQMNTGYYIMGSKDVLVQAGVLESHGLFKKKTLNPASLKAEGFTKVDKRTFTTLTIPSKTVKILSQTPASSYQLIPNGSYTVLKVVDANAFWGASSFLVIQAK